jgi:hypothetical protein
MAKKIPGESGGRRKVGTDQGSPTAGTTGGTRSRPQKGDINPNNLSSGAVPRGQRGQSETVRAEAGSPVTSPT